MRKASIKIEITRIKFPVELAVQENEKVILLVKLQQWYKGKCFEMVSKEIKIKDEPGEIIPSENDDYVIFNLEKLSLDDAEKFSVALIVKKISQPVPHISERLLIHEEMSSKDQNQLFPFTQKSGIAKLKSKYIKTTPFEVEWNMEVNHDDTVEVGERQGKRLLVGRYAMHEGAVNFVKSLDPRGIADIVNITTKETRLVPHTDLDFIEEAGVNVFPLIEEPKLLKNCKYEWILDMDVNDKRLVN